MKRALTTQVSVYNLKILVFGLLAIVSAGCVGTSHPTSSNPSKKSLSTGIPFNEGEDSFQVHPFKEQARGPGMVFIEGGMTTIGVIAERSPHDPNPYIERTVSVASFFISDTATTNLNWREYLHALFAFLEVGVVALMPCFLCCIGVL